MLESFDSDIQFGSHGNYFDFFSKGIALQTIHVFQVILKHVGRHGANMGIETFCTRLIQVLTTETYNVLH